MKYVLMFCETESYQQAWEAKSQAERDRATEKVDGWFAANADQIIGGRSLQPAHTVTPGCVGEKPKYIQYERLSSALPGTTLIHSGRKAAGSRDTRCPLRPA